MRYIIAPLDLSEEQGHIYKLLYKKADFKTMIVEYTKNQLLVDSSPLFKLTEQKIKTILNYLLKEKMIIELKKGHKGSPTIYEIITMKQLLFNQQLSNQYVTTNQQLSNNNDVVIPMIVEVEQPQCNHNVTTMQPQTIQPIKDKDKEKEIKDIPSDKFNTKKILELWNSMDNICKVKKISPTREKHLNARVNEYDIETVYKVIELVSESDFLKGKTKDKDGKSFKCDFDWILNPNNFVKILEEKYKNKDVQAKSKTWKVKYIE